MAGRVQFIVRLFVQSAQLLARWIWLRFASPAPSARNANPLLVIYSQCAWQGVWQRPHELAVGMARRGHRVLYVAPMQVHERIGRFRGSTDIYQPPEHPNLTIFSPLIFSGEYRWSWIFRLNKKRIAAELRRVLASESSVSLFANTPLVEPLIESIPHQWFVYDVMDDYSAFDWAPDGSQAMEERLLKRANVVLTGTYALKDKVAPIRPDAQFVPCGVNFDRFYRGSDAPREELPDDVKNLPRPFIGYVGTLSERVDADLLRKLSTAFSNASIFLIGPVYRTLGPPPEAPNIHYLGLKRHEDLGPYMRAFDAALLPFRMTQAVMAINPVKMLEYLAAGCVVVSTAIPDVMRFYADVALIADSHEEFIEKLRQALTEDQSERIARGIELARKSSWDAMVDAMAQAILSRD